MPAKTLEAARASRRKWYANNSEHAKQRTRERLRELQQWVREYKEQAGLVCQQCGEADIACLDFHHRDPAEKETNISGIHLKGWSKARILAEFAKCDVLCANCHRKLHHRERAEKLGSVM